MPDENPNEQLRHWDAMERETIYVMTDPDRWPAIWSVADLGRELETNDPDAVLRPLVNAGLVHRIAGGFVFASASAFKMVALVGQVV
jgi:hypothetical protein